ncbi:glycoside hydrolase superfamily [Poronia punctata]|nr:glycoside hydrolase superfamily [Poronia punctata]
MAETRIEDDVQKEAESHVDRDDNFIRTPSGSPAVKNLFSRKKVIVIISISIMIAVTALALGLGLGLGLADARPNRNSASSSNSKADFDLGLTPGTTWDYPLGFSLTTKNVDKDTQFYVVDLENTSKNDIADLINAGHTIVCYFSAGSVESYRDDAGDFPDEAIGKTLDGWDEEQWLDVRNEGVRDVMTQRIRTAVDKGCQGVDPDNVDGYQNESGFDMTEDDAVDYVRFLAEEAHSQGLAFGLKNAGDIVEQVVDVAEWAINEECVEWDECDSWAPFIDAGKPVFHVEYTEDDDATSVSPSQLKEACAAGGNSDFSTIVKHLPLDDWVVKC